MLAVPYCSPQSDTVKPSNYTKGGYFDARFAAIRSQVCWSVFYCEESQPSFSCHSVTDSMDSTDFTDSMNSTDSMDSTNSTNYFLGDHLHPSLPLRTDPCHRQLSKGSQLVIMITTRLLITGRVSVLACFIGEGEEVLLFA